MSCKDCEKKAANRKPKQKLSAKKDGNKQKIAEILCGIAKEQKCSNCHYIENCGLQEDIAAILVLMEQEQALMVEALTLSRKHIGHLLQNPDKYKKTGETHEVLAKIDAASKGGS